MLSEFKIDPSTIAVPVGQPIDFSVMNMGQASHTFAVDVAGKTYATDLIDPGTTVVLKVPALDAGTYAAYCTVSGHKDLGMLATVTAGAATGATGAAGTSSSSMSAAMMAAMHKAGVDAFLAGNQTSTQGNQLLKPTMDGTTKVFTLTASNVKWEVSKGQFVDAMAFNGQIPGPQIDVSYGDHIRIVVENQLDQPTVVHFHGMTVPNAMDGVPYITQDPIMPGQVWTYEFTVKDPPGMYVYHSHFNSTEQVGAGLYGALIVQPQGGLWPYPALTVNDRTGATTVGAPVKVDDESTLFLGDGPLGYVLNGKSFPATSPIVAKQGRLGPDPHGERRLDAAPDASARLPLRSRGAGRVPARAAVHGGHPGDRARTAVRRADPRRSTPAPGRSTATSFPTWKGRRACTGW